MTEPCWVVKMLIEESSSSKRELDLDDYDEELDCEGLSADSLMRPSRA